MSQVKILKVIYRLASVGSCAASPVFLCRNSSLRCACDVQQVRLMISSSRRQQARADDSKHVPDRAREHDALLRSTTFGMYPFTGVRVSCLFLLRTVFSFTSEPFVALLLLPLRSVAALAPQLERSAVYPGAGGRMANSWDEAAVRELSRLPTVDRAFALGSVLAVEMKAAKRGCARTRVLQSSLRGTRSHMKRETGQERERERQREPRAERLSRKFGMFLVVWPVFRVSPRLEMATRTPEHPLPIFPTPAPMYPPPPRPRPLAPRNHLAV